MGARRHRDTTPTAHVIATAQADIVRRCRNVVADRAHASCWACGISYEDGAVEFAHILANSQGGTEVPENFLLLCHRCHKDQPDGLPREVQIAWLETHRSYQDMHMWEWGPVIIAMCELGERVGCDRDLLNVWANENGIQHLLLGFNESANMTCNPNTATMLSNGRWGFFEAFRKWLETRKKETA